MNKSSTTNLVALLLVIVGHFAAQPVVFAIGLFALSGAVTNWLAVHMLFEKIPGLYGSGVIPARFEDFKLGIRELMMKQFFTKENIDRFLSDDDSPNKKGGAGGIDLTPMIEKVDLNPAFDGLVDVIENSQFGGMLAMVGGSEVIQPMREPFIEKMKSAVKDITQTDDFHQNLRELLEGDSNIAHMQEKVSDIIQQRLDELTPQLVKEIIQDMIRKHLGWLVVWGGVFGGVIGCIAALTNTF